ncbi:MAG: hypothetical protein SGARI_006007, partial [Bacillariaceae sp.]
MFLVAILTTAVQADKTSLSAPTGLTRKRRSPAFAKKVDVLSNINVLDSQNPKTCEPKALVARGGATRKATKTNESGPLQNTFQWYMKSCTEKPLLTKGTTAGLIAALGDFIAQQLEARHSDSANGLNFPRMATFFLVNFVFTGPFVHNWYQLVADVGNWVQTRYNTSQWVKLLVQISMDQSIGVALFFPLYLFFYEMMDTLVRLQQVPQFSQALSKCQQHVAHVILMQYRLFPVANLINFAFVPEPLRVLFSNTVSLFWNIYLCSV